MLKRYTAILLIIALAVINFQRYLVYAGFELNRGYIAENLCINKNRPWMHCNGHCYFMRKIKEAQQRESNNQRETQKNRFQETIIHKTAIIDFYTGIINLINTPYQQLRPTALPDLLFRPPRHNA